MVKEKGKRKLRKVVTGDPDKRLRDHMREVPQVHTSSLPGPRTEKENQAFYRLYFCGAVCKLPKTTEKFMGYNS